jgi:hypothetical protein
MYRYPYQKDCIPPNGVYFQYESGEISGPEGKQQRIVRVGSHTGPKNLPKRLREHFSPSDRWMNFSISQPKASDRSVFRKHIGRAFLNRSHDPYLKIWNIDFTKTKNRNEKRHLRNIDKEHSQEKQITDWIRSTISFRFIIVDDEGYRLRLEAHCIGTVAYCTSCQPSTTWLGKDSPIKAICESGLWNVKHVDGPGIDEADKQIIEVAVKETLEWMKKKGCMD